MDENQLKTWVLRQLGAPQVKVELHPADLDDALEDTKEWFAGQKGVEKRWSTSLISGQAEYAVPDDADNVLDVVIAVPPFDMSLIFSPYILADEKVPYDVFAAPESAGLYSSLAQSIQYTDMAKRVLSAEFNWMWLEDQRKVVVSPVPRHSGDMIITYKQMGVVPQQLDYNDHLLFKRMMLAKAKMKLGTVYTKYDGNFPGAHGDRRVNGEILKQEAQTEMEKLEEDIRKSQYPLPFITG
jgi:hypothetical protein